MPEFPVDSVHSSSLPSNPARLPQSTETQPRKNVGIEKLRATAIVFVILWHYRPILLDPFGIGHNYYALWTGVDLFFVISGYVIAKSLLEIAPDTRLRAYLLQFYTKRIFRITPSAIMYIAVALCFAYAVVPVYGPALLQDTLSDTRPSLLNYANWAYYFKAKNHGGTLLGIFWSLSLEEQFYLAVPLVIWLFRGRPKILISALGAAAIFQAALPRPPWGTLAWSLRTDGLIYGVILALAEHNTGGYFERASKAYAKLKRYIIRGIVGLLILLLATVASDLAHLPRSTSWAALCATALVFIAIIPRDDASRSAGRTDRVLLWIGSRSYSLYLFHNLMLILVNGVNVKFTHIAFNAANPFYYVFVFTSLALLSLVAEANYRFLEMPVRNYGRRLVRGRDWSDLKKSGAFA